MQIMKSKSTDMRPCFRCNGQKKMYKGSGDLYSLINFGGAYVDCPMCLGKGEIKTLDAANKDVVKKDIVNKDVVEEVKKLRKYKKEADNERSSST